MNEKNIIMDIIQKQFLKIMQDDPDYYKKYNIILTNEQQYVKKSDIKTDNIFIVVKLLEGSINYGQTLTPVNFNILGEGNKIDVCQRLLLEYAQTFNLCEEININKEETDDGNEYIVKQVYTQPQVLSNFEETWNEFRSLFFMSGSFLIGKNSLPITDITFYENIDSEVGEKINFINATWDFSVQLDSQAFYGTDSRTTSKSKISTLVLNFTIYLCNNKICQKILGMSFNNKEWAPNGIKEKFYFDINFKNNLKISKMEFYLANATSNQNIGEFPLLSLGFTN